MAATDPTTDHLVAAALAHASHGWRVFPVVPGGKRPAVKDWEARATTEPDRIRRCWSAGPYNIGIACGPSRLLVIDLDRPKPDAEGQPPDPRPPAWQLPGIEDGGDVLATLAERAGRPGPWDTRAVTTPSGGLHLYFNQPAGKQLRNTAGRLGWLVDTRGQGGYVVAAGSVTDAGRYRTLNPVEPVTLPFWLLHALTAPEPDHSTTGDYVASAASIVADVRRRSAYAGSALRRELDAVLTSQPGQRNHTLNRAAHAIGQLTGADLIPVDLATHAFTRAAAAIGLPEPEAAATIASGLAAGARHPRKVRA